MKHEKKLKYKKPILGHWQLVNIGLMLYDLFAINVSFFLALWLRFYCRYSEIPVNCLETYFKLAPIYSVLCLLIFGRARLYRSIWRFASYSELLRVVTATVVTAVVQIVGVIFFFQITDLHTVKGQI